MERRFEDLAEGPFDLLVVGGGLQGAWVAYDAALRGLSVAIVESEDWGAFAPLTASSLLRGSLRRLEGDRSLGTEAVAEERAILQRIAPHHVRELGLLMPFYVGHRPGWARMRMGLWMRQPAAADRDSRLADRVLDREEVAHELPLSPAGLKGGFLLQETLCDFARLALEIVDGASRASAIAVNRARALALLTEGRRTVGAVVQDRETGRTLEVRALVTACCAGAWNACLVAPDGERAPAARAPRKGIHLVLPALPTEHAVAIGDPRGRVALLLPWHGRTLVSACSRELQPALAEPLVEVAEVSDLLDQVCTAIDVSWLESDVIAAFATMHSAPSNEREPEEPMDCLLVLEGGAGLSSRSAAAAAVGRTLDLLGRPAVSCTTAVRPLPWCAADPGRPFCIDVLRRGLALGLDEETLLGLIARYGARVEGLLTRIRETPALGRRIVADAPFCHAELVHAATAEMAGTLEDVLRRRVPLPLVAGVSERTIREVAAVLGALHQWTDERRQREIDILLGHEQPATAVPITA